MLSARSSRQVGLSGYSSASDALMQAPILPAQSYAISPEYVQVPQNNPHPNQPSPEEVDQFRRVVYDLYDTAVIHPTTSWAKNWNVFMLMSLFFSAFSVPYELAYEPLRVSMSLTLEVALDFVFALDTVLQFFIAFETKSYHYCYDHHQIVFHYLCTEFILDFISCLPLSSLYFLGHSFLGNSTPKGHLIAIAYLRYCRVMRLSRFRRCKRRFIYEISASFIQKEIFTNIMVISVALHWIACVWGLSAAFDPEHNWIQELRDLPRSTTPFVDMDGWSDGVQCYFLSLYFAMYVLSGIGLGDVSPVNVVEHVSAMVCMLFGALVWATVLASVVNVYTAWNEPDMMLQRRMDVMNKIARTGRFEPALRQTIHEFLVRHKSGTAQQTEQRSMVELLSPSLQMQVTLKCNSEWLMKVKFCKRILEISSEANSFLVEFAWSMESMMFRPGEFIDLQTHLCVVIHGIGLIGNGVCLRNSVWGQDFMLKKMSLRKPLSVLCLTYMAIKVMSLEQLNQLLLKYPLERKIMQRERVKLIVVRGMIQKAEQLRKVMAKDPKLQWEDALLILQKAQNKSNHSRHSLASIEELQPAHATMSGFGLAARPTVDTGGADDDDTDLVGQANIPEYVAKIKQDQERMHSEVQDRFNSLEAQLAQMAKGLERIRTTPWTTA